MKTTAFLFAFVFASMASAQSNVSTGKASRSKSVLSGFYVGADYMNLTDVKVGAKVHNSQYNVSGEMDGHQGMSLGTLGVRLGYESNVASKLAVCGGLRFAEAFNSGEYGDTKLQFLIAESNLSYSLLPVFAGYLGVNYGEVMGPSKANDAYQGNFGWQAGFAVKATSHIVLNLGYTVLNQKLDMSESKTSANGYVRFSGFTSSLNYVF